MFRNLDLMGTRTGPPMRLDCPLCGTEMSVDLTGSGLGDAAEAEWDVLRDALDVHWDAFCPGEEAGEDGNGLRRGTPDMEMV